MEIRDVVTALTHVDGSCRDVNFERPTWAGVDDLIESLKSSFSKASAGDAEGEAIALLDPGSVSAAARETGSAHVIFEGGSGLMSFLQIFVSREADESPFVELTFLPQDVEETEDLKLDFLLWANEMRLRLSASRYYARYENASWKFGDIGPDSGVFLVSTAGSGDA